MRDVGAVILAGGRSRRMGGQDKALLQLYGKTFLERLTEQLGGFDELLLSVNERERYSGSGLTVVEDAYTDCGPISGLYAALTACKSEWLLAVSCDMPLFERDLADYLLSYLSPAYDAVVATTRDGWRHPLCAVYNKRVAGLLREQLEAGNYRMNGALSSMRTKPALLQYSAFPDETVSNINTPAQYAILQRRVYGPPVIAVSGVKNSGKTTLLTGILPRLCAQGLRVAVIKHDGHDFAPDVPDTDSYRIRAAGAYGVAVYSGARFMLTAETPETSVEKLIKQFPEADLVLLEGGKRTAYPKIQVVRGAVAERFQCDPDTLLAVCTDTEMRTGASPVLDMNDYEGVSGVIVQYLQKQGYLNMGESAMHDSGGKK